MNTFQWLFNGVTCSAAANLSCLLPYHVFQIMSIIVNIDKYEEIERGARNMFQKTQYPSRQFFNTRNLPTKSADVDITSCVKFVSIADISKNSFRFVKYAPVT